MCSRLGWRTCARWTALASILFAVEFLPSASAFAEQNEPVIEPQVDRRNIRVPKIDVDDIEFGIYGGILSVQDFGSKPVYGARLAYHLTEDFFLEGAYGKSTVSDESFRRLGIAVFQQPEVDLSYYHLSVGYNLFPGEVFFGKKWAMTSAVYLVGGVGSVNFNNENNTAFNFGIGVRALPTTWLAVRAEIRDLLFESDVLGKNELKHNFELTLGVSAYF
jgi:outer membrane beta-barrel protein